MTKSRVRFKGQLSYGDYWPHSHTESLMGRRGHDWTLDNSKMKLGQNSEYLQYLEPTNTWKIPRKYSLTSWDSLLCSRKQRVLVGGFWHFPLAAPNHYLQPKLSEWSQHRSAWQIWSQSQQRRCTSFISQRAKICLWTWRYVIKCIDWSVFDLDVPSECLPSVSQVGEGAAACEAP